MKRQLLSGNEAVARGAYEAGVAVGAAYPGTPSTEILETLATYKGVRAEWCANEKVAFEVALGASLAGLRALVAMKHVGVNVASDSLITAAYTGVRGGLVVVSADDPGMHSSQNEQDNRWYARLAKLPLLEPADSEEARRFTREALQLSERFETPVILRLTTRICHTRTVVAPEPAHRRRRRARFARDSHRYVMLPGHARPRHAELEAGLERLAEESEQSPLNVVLEGSRELGIVAGGVVFQYAREVAPHASFFKLGMSYPLPIRRLKAFARRVKDLVVVEELDDLVATELRAAGIACQSKRPSLRQGELNPDRVRAILADEPFPVSYAAEGRRPVLCPGCPHRHVFYILRKLRALVTGDIGCYTLGALPPLASMDTCVAMGASVGLASGLDGVLPEEDRRRVVAVIGDSTFFHAGIPGLVDAVYNRRGVSLVILDNNTTAMTGLQDHPGTGRALQDRPAQRVDVAELCRGVGIKHVVVVDPYDLSALEAALKKAMAVSEPAVVVARRSCVLVARPEMEPLVIDAETCRNCKVCVETGCPAIRDGELPIIDPVLCVGCGLCAEACRFGAIGSAEREELP